MIQLTKMPLLMPTQLYDALPNRKHANQCYCNATLILEELKMDAALREYLRGPVGPQGREGKTGSPGLTVSLALVEKKC